MPLFAMKYDEDTYGMNKTQSRNTPIKTQIQVRNPVHGSLPLSVRILERLR